MNKQLTTEDRRAIDLLLNDGLHSRGEGHQSYAAHAATSPDRIAAVERLLNTLGRLPVEEPGMDLVQRTLSLIERPHFGLPTVSPDIASRAHA